MKCRLGLYCLRNWASHSRDFRVSDGATAASQGGVTMQVLLKCSGSARRYPVRPDGHVYVIAHRFAGAMAAQ